ncbi:T9SS type A sorting domain-containing protein [Maribacter litopenaei]|uniref:T9SS type A sorting domain-containing protein n=1 Tax=Maribacter litopenaei TaxID=2976127 RepID=A0ABY5Y6Y2_9FLAO|nr:T9SS type A sorting domain-containing protein [Maribacter litopenaei]UWX54240.1 T9SS type A sorting domain-containing protein [Maribacter litopenaei]
MSDCDDTDPNIFEATTWYLDADGDGYAASTMESCNSPGTGYTQNVLPVSDCDDTDPDVFEATTWFLDADGDGYAASTMESCNSPGTGYTQNALPVSDCDDTDPNIFEATTWYLDADGDGYAASTMESCNSPGTGYTQYALPVSDCDDTNEMINPETVWYDDENGDGIADSDQTIIGCENPGSGYTYVEPTPFINESEIILYPNPSTETIKINLGKIQNRIAITIINSNKQLVFKKQFENKKNIEIETSLYSSGIYFIYLSNEDGYLTSKKMIKL